MMSFHALVETVSKSWILQLVLSTSIGAVIGWLLNEFYFHRSKELKLFEWELYSFPTRTSVSVSGDAKPRPVVNTYLRIRNIGNQTIQSADLCDRITIDGNLKKLEGSFIRCRPCGTPSRHHQLSCHIDNRRTITVSINFLRPREIMIIAIRHTYLDCCVALEATTKVTGPARRKTPVFYKFVSFLSRPLVRYVLVLPLWIVLAWVLYEKWRSNVDIVSGSFIAIIVAVIVTYFVLAAFLNRMKRWQMARLLAQFRNSTPGGSSYHGLRLEPTGKTARSKSTEQTERRTVGGKR